MLNFILTWALGTTLWAADNKIPEILARVQAKLIHKDQTALVALSFENAPEWHTYWKYPGDAGLAIKTDFSLDGATTLLNEEEWPAPKRYIEEGNLLAFGYVGAYTLFYRLPENYLAQNTGKTLVVKSNWLICRHICIPGKGEFKLVLGTPGTQEASHAGFDVPEEELWNRHAALPPLATERHNELDFVLGSNADKKLSLYYNLDPKGKGVLKNTGLLMPMPLAPFNPMHEKLFKGRDGHLYGRLDFDWDGEYQTPPIDFPKDGAFPKPYTLSFLYFPPGEAGPVVIQKSFAQFSLEAGKKIEEMQASFTPYEGEEGLSSSEGPLPPTPIVLATDSSLLFYLFLAFIGGLILNIMPCVLPVISLKLFALIQTRDQGKKALLQHNLLYSAGVIFTFILLAAATVLIKSLGPGANWGMQLQSPSFILGMIIILFVMTLNLFELFEFKTPGGNLLPNLKFNDGPVKDFFGGMLATVLSTPCSAPFLGTALTFAFSSSPEVIFLVFIFVGLGLAFPFLIIAPFPKLISFLPKPGLWMVHVKKFLGLMLIFTSIWLLDVFLALTMDWGTTPLLLLLSGLTLLFFAFYFNRHIGKKAYWKTLFCLLPVLALCWTLYRLQTPPETAQAATGLQGEGDSVLWEPWTPAKMEELRQARTKTFVDFTAKWCFTCKANEKLVLETDSFRELAREHGLKLLLADWTRRDPVIGQWLASQGMVGIPAYFVITAEGKIVNLGETITVDKIRKALE